ncbi:MAG: hypothetical protein ACXW2E_01180 [Nitrososphaeraceae archaeon]
MGYTRWDEDEWRSISVETSTKPAEKIFTSRTIHSDLNPLNVAMRESRDSDLNPKSTPIIVGCDVTGSMGMIADYLIKTGLGILFQEILDRKPVTDPHLMIMAIGDAAYDSAPLQVSQFESDTVIVDQLTKVYIEHGGGGNRYESYELPWYFAANHTSTDSFEKRNKKGYLFTIGDEEPSRGVIASQIKRFIGDTPQSDISLIDMYDQVSKMYNTYHIIVAEGNYCRRNVDKVKDLWCNVIGQNTIVLEDYKKLSEVITSIIEVNEGRDKDEVVASWSGDTSLVVQNAVSGLTATNLNISPSIVRF